MATSTNRRLSAGPPIKRPSWTRLFCFLALAIGAQPAQAALPLGLLHTQGTRIVDALGQKYRLRGFNLGGWFVMETYMSPMDRSYRLNDSYSVMQTLTRRFGQDEADRLISAYQQNWIGPDDIAKIARAGYNAVRIPIWWGQFLRLDDPTPSGWRADAFQALDRIIAACMLHGVLVVIDMHGVVGGQSVGANTGRAEQNSYWTDPKAQSTTLWLWKKIASHYRGNPFIAGYDLLNEPRPPAEMPLQETVWNAYDSLYRGVRSTDPEHMIFIEAAFGDWTLDMLPPPSRFGWSNVVYESHSYAWPFVYSGTSRAAAVKADATRIANDFAAHADWQVPGYVGELNALDQSPQIWQSLISIFDQAGLGWAMWTYKAPNNGHGFGYWGYVENTAPLRQPDPSSDDAQSILEDWQAWRSQNGFEVNPDFSNIGK